MNLINQLYKESSKFTGLKKFINRNVKNVDSGALDIKNTVKFKGGKNLRGLKFKPDPKLERDMNTTWLRSKLDKNLGEKTTNKLYGKGRDIKKYVKENKSPLGAAALGGSAIGVGGAYAAGKALQNKEAAKALAHGKGKMKGIDFIPSKKLVDSYNAPTARFSRFVGRHKGLALATGLAGVSSGGYAVKKYFDKKNNETSN